MELLAELAVIAGMSRAWLESQADDPIERHEEGGYIVLNPDLTHGVQRWPRGQQSRIAPPPLDANNCYNGRAVVAAFHTHPNPPIDEVGREWEQRPSESDRRWHARRKLRGFVVSRALIYEIDADANIAVLGKRNEVLHHGPAPESPS